MSQCHTRITHFFPSDYFDLSIVTNLLFLVKMLVKSLHKPHCGNENSAKLQEVILFAINAYFRAQPTTEVFLS